VVSGPCEVLGGKVPDATRGASEGKLNCEIPLRYECGAIPMAFYDACAARGSRRTTGPYAARTGAEGFRSLRATKARRCFSPGIFPRPFLAHALRFRGGVRLRAGAVFSSIASGRREAGEGVERFCGRNGSDPCCGLRGPHGERGDPAVDVASGEECDAGRTRMRMCRADSFEDLPGASAVRDASALAAVAAQCSNDRRIIDGSCETMARPAPVDSGDGDCVARRSGSCEAARAGWRVSFSRIPCSRT